MTSPLDKEATQLEIIADRAFIAAIGQALVKKGVISHKDVANELAPVIEALEKTPSSDSKLLALELKNILGSVLTWGA